MKFKNFKARPVKAEYKELLDTQSGEFTIVPRGTHEQQAQIRSTITGVQFEAVNDTEDRFPVLAANGGELTYEFEVNFDYNRQKKRTKR